jgi:hypothetical protein
MPMAAHHRGYAKTLPIAEAPKGLRPRAIFAEISTSNSTLIWLMSKNITKTAAKWQTRRTQNPVLAAECRFDPDARTKVAGESTTTRA